MPKDFQFKWLRNGSFGKKRTPFPEISRTSPVQSFAFPSLDGLSHFIYTSRRKIIFLGKMHLS
jgi:hypothetical protein